MATFNVLWNLFPVCFDFEFSKCLRLCIIRKGYKNIIQNCMANARVLREEIERTGRFNVVSKEHGVPVVAFSLKDSGRYTVFDISDDLRRFGWIVPAYTMPPDAEHVAVLRVVIREDFSRRLAERLAGDIERVVAKLDAKPTHATEAAAAAAAGGARGGEGSGKRVKKSAEQTQREITSYWKGLADGRRTRAC